MDLYDISVKDVPNRTFLKQTVEKGQKVRLTRMVTITYTVDVSAILEDSDEEYISLETLISDEMENVGYSAIVDMWDEVDEEDEVCIRAEIL